MSDPTHVDFVVVGNIINTAEAANDFADWLKEEGFHPIVIAVDPEGEMADPAFHVALPPVEAKNPRIETMLMGLDMASYFAADAEDGE